MYYIKKNEKRIEGQELVSWLKTRPKDNSACNLWVLTNTGTDTLLMHGPENMVWYDFRSTLVLAATDFTVFYGLQSAFNKPVQRERLYRLVYLYAGLPGYYPRGFIDAIELEEYADRYWHARKTRTWRERQAIHIGASSAWKPGGKKQLSIFAIPTEMAFNYMLGAQQCQNFSLVK